MDVEKKSGRLLRFVLLLFALVLITYGVTAILYGFEQNAFKVPESPGRAVNIVWAL